MSNTSPSSDVGALRRGVWVLTLVAVAEVGVFFWQRARTEALVDRLLDVQTMTALDIDSRLGLLILLDETTAGLSYDNLRALQAAGAAWLEDYVQRHAVDASKAELLRGLLTRYLADYAGERVAQAVRSPGTAPTARSEEQTRRFFRAVRHVLGESEAAVFEQEIRAAWGTWMP